MSIVFEYADDERRITHEVSEESTWMNLVDNFVMFMQGCGYEVDSSDVANYLDSNDNSGCGNCESCGCNETTSDVPFDTQGLTTGIKNGTITITGYSNTGPYTFK